MTARTKTNFAKGRRWVLALSAALMMALLPATESADAVIEQIYTLPFYDSYNLSCGFGCYSGHQGTDYELGVAGQGGERVAAGARGTAKSDCGLSATAGYYLVMDHGNGHRTRYLHLNAAPLPANGSQVARGVIVGYEGNTGYTDPPGFYHLHFETRHGATGAATCGKDGTAVDPYGSSTYMWTLDPPVYAASSCYLPQDSASGPGRYPGVFRPSQNNATWWHLRYSNTSGNANNSFIYGETCDMPIVGDWDGDGDDTVGVVRRVGGVLQWHLSNNNSTPVTFSYGNATDLPVAGDWNGNGTDSIGVFRPSEARWYLSNDNITASYIFLYGNPTDRPVAGDWDGDGDVNIGVVRPLGGVLEWILRYYNGQGPANLQFTYGNNTDVPITGDWDWDGDDTIGTFRPSEAKWYLRNSNTAGGTPSITPFMYGAISDKPITGDWN